MAVTKYNAHVNFFEETNILPFKERVYVEDPED
jgi:hypothetical protein